MPSEKGPSEYPYRERMNLPLPDDVIRDAIANPDAGAGLHQQDPVTWLRGAIGIQTERGASEILDRELLIRYVEYGRIEWDPFVVKSVARYLKAQGFSWSL